MNRDICSCGSYAAVAMLCPVLCSRISAMPSWNRLKRELHHCSVLFVCFYLFVGPQAHGESNANDHIFPAAQVAKDSIDFDNRGFLIHGKRTFIVSAGM